MICGLSGIVQECRWGRLSLDVRDVVYSVHVCESFKPGVGDTVFLFTTLIHKEDSMKLYGFERDSDRVVFDKLLRIQRVGPSTAMLIVGRFCESELVYIVENKNINYLLDVKGVGKKTAQTIVDNYKLGKDK